MSEPYFERYRKLPRQASSPAGEDPMPILGRELAENEQQIVDASRENLQTRQIPYSQWLAGQVSPPPASPPPSPPPPPPSPPPTAAPLSITTQTTATPSTSGGGTVTLGVGQDSVMLWLADAVQDSEPFVDLYVNDGTSTVSIRVHWKQPYLFTAAAGATLGIGALAVSGSGVARALSVTPQTAPVAVGSGPYSVTGTINSDHNYPDEWTPSTVRVTLPSDDCYFQIDNSGKQQSIMYMAGTNGAGDWSPVEAIHLETNRVVTVFSHYKRVALCHPDGGGWTINAPVGSTVNTSGASNTLGSKWDDEFVSTGTVEVTDNTGFTAALQALSTSASNPNDIIIDDVAAIRTITSPATIHGGVSGLTNLPNRSYRIRSKSGDKSRSILRCSWGLGSTGYINGSDSVRIDFKNVTWEQVSGATNMFIQNGKVRMQGCDITRSSGSATSILELACYNGGVMDGRLFNCRLIGLAGTNNMTDNFAGRLGTGSLTGAKAVLVGCAFQYCGNASSDNLITSHGGFPLYVWGGRSADPGTNDTGGALNNDATTTPSYFFGHYGSESNGNYYRISNGSTIRGSHFVSLGSSSGGGTITSFGLIEASYITFKTANTAACILAHASNKTYLVGNSFQIDSTTTVPLILASGSTAYVPYVVGNDLDSGAGRTWYFSHAGSTQLGVVDFIFNYDRGGSAASFDNRTAQTAGTDRYLFNLFVNTPTWQTSTSLKNLLLDGNAQTGATFSTTGGTSARGTSAPIRNTANLTFQLESDGTPTENGNVDWSTFVSGLSGGSLTTLLQRLPVQLGYMGVGGRTLALSTSRVPLGPREIQKIHTGGRLIPVRL